MLDIFAGLIVSDGDLLGFALLLVAYAIFYTFVIAPIFPLFIAYRGWQRKNKLLLAVGIGLLIISAGFHVYDYFHSRNDLPYKLQLTKDSIDAISDFYLPSGSHLKDLDLLIGTDSYSFTYLDSLIKADEYTTANNRTNQLKNNVTDKPTLDTILQPTPMTCNIKAIFYGVSRSTGQPDQEYQPATCTTIATPKHRKIIITETNFKDKPALFGAYLRDSMLLTTFVSGDNPRQRIIDIVDSLEPVSKDHVFKAVKL